MSMKMWTAIALAGISLAGAQGPATAAETPLPLSQVLATAERAVGGQVTDAELEIRRDGRTIYEIELVRSGDLFELDIDATSGRIIARRQPMVEGAWERLADRQERRYLANARAASTLLRALETRTGGRALSLSFETEGGRAYYEVELASQIGVTEVFLDPATGSRLPLVPDD